MHVYLKDGRVLVYNRAEKVSHDNNIITLSERDDKYFIAKINLDIFERIDGEAPCRIYRRKNKLAR